MAQINVSKLTFAYEGSAENVFEQVSFSIDTNWKLGFIGRNGKGKTTFLNLLLGKYAYQGSITKGIAYDYFPYRVSVEEGELTADELMEHWKPGVESWRVRRGPMTGISWMPVSTMCWCSIVWESRCRPEPFPAGGRTRSGKTRMP